MIDLLVQQVQQRIGQGANSRQPVSVTNHPSASPSKSPPVRQRRSRVRSIQEMADEAEQGRGPVPVSHSSEAWVNQSELSPGRTHSDQHVSLAMAEMGRGIKQPTSPSSSKKAKRQIPKVSMNIPVLHLISSLLV